MKNGIVVLEYANPINWLKGAEPDEVTGFKVGKVIDETNSVGLSEARGFATAISRDGSIGVIVDLRDEMNPRPGLDDLRAEVVTTLMPQAWAKSVEVARAELAKH